MAFILWTLVLTGVIAFTGNADAKFETLDSFQIQTLSEILCKENTWKAEGIGHLSTIGKLVNYFRSDSLPERFNACRDKFLEPLQELNVVVNKHQEDVCSHENIEGIRKFHWDYVVGDLSRKWSKASSKSLPGPLMIFFMHYANGVAERCKMNMINRLNAAAAGIVIAEEPTRLVKKIAGTVDDLSMVLVPESRVKNFDSFILPWDQFLIKERKAGRLHENVIDDATGERVIGLIKVKDPSRAWTLQHQCRHSFRPIYQNTVLPVMQLFEMGYGRVDERSRRIISANHDLVGRWYAMTQLCELLIPLSFYRDPSLRGGKAVILSSISETKGLGRVTNVVAADKIPIKQGVPKVELDDLLPIPEDGQITELVKFNLKNRNRLFRIFFKNITLNMKNKLKNKLKNIFVSKKTRDNRYVQESGVQVVKETEPEVSDITSEVVEQEESKTSPSPSSEAVHSKFVSDAVGIIVKIYVILIFLALAAGFIFGLVLPVLTVS